MPTVDHSENLIRINSISFAYAGRQVLSGMTLDIHRGDYLGIIGPNGGGKTTLLKIILGLLSPTGGTVTLFDKPVEEFRQWYRIGYVPQKSLNFDTQFPATVAEVVEMGLYGKKGLFHGLNARDQSAIKNVLQHVEMEEFAARLIGNLSGGQQQRVFIARALVAKPEILFLDEPTAGVDAQAQEQFYLLLRKLNKSMGITLVLVSHDLDVVTHETTEVACINQSLIYHGSPKEFVEGDVLSKLYGKGFKFVAHHH